MNKKLFRKILSDWLAVDLAIYGTPVRKQNYGFDLKDWVEAKRDMIEEAYVSAILFDNQDIDVITESYGIVDYEEYQSILEAAKEKAEMAKENAAATITESYDEDTLEELAEELALNEGIELEEARRIITNTAYVEEVLKHIVGEENEGIPEVLRLVEKDLIHAARANSLDV